MSEIKYIRFQTCKIVNGNGSVSFEENRISPATFRGKLDEPSVSSFKRLEQTNSGYVITNPVTDELEEVILSHDSVVRTVTKHGALLYEEYFPFPPTMQDALGFNYTRFFPNGAVECRDSTGQLWKYTAKYHALGCRCFSCTDNDDLLSMMGCEIMEADNYCYDCGEVQCKCAPFICFCGNHPNCRCCEECGNAPKYCICCKDEY